MSRRRHAQHPRRRDRSCRSSFRTHATPEKLSRGAARAAARRVEVRERLDEQFERIRASLRQNTARESALRRSCRCLLGRQFPDGEPLQDRRAGDSSAARPAPAASGGARAAQERASRRRVKRFIAFGAHEQARERAFVARAGNSPDSRGRACRRYPGTSRGDHRHVPARALRKRHSRRLPCAS